MKQGTKEWEHLRKSYIGASDSPILMGVVRWKMEDGRIKTPRILWEEKLGLLDIKVNAYATGLGKEMEPKILNHYQNLKGETYNPKVLFHPDKKFIMASLDGLNEKCTHAVEIKFANAEDHSIALDGKIPEKYYPQVQHQLDVLYALYGITKMDYLSYHNEDFITVEVSKNDAYLEKLWNVKTKFWHCVQNFEEPALTEDDFIEQDERWGKTAQMIYDIKSKIKDLTAEEKELTALIREMSQGKNSRGSGFRFSHHIRKGSVDYKSIPEIKSINLDPYRKSPSSIWQLRKEKC